MAALATEEAEWRGTPRPTGIVWATRAARRSARTQLVGHGSDGAETKQNWKEDFDSPIPGAPNIGFRAPQTRERFELWDVCEELNLYGQQTRRPTA